LLGEPVSLLKPLHGAEPKLFENLGSFLTIDHARPIQLICGVQRADDPAIPVVERLRATYPDADIRLVLDPTAHGSNAKVSNLINMSRAVKHDLIILSDSDMAAPRDYLSRIGRAMAEAGAVTCPYHGRGDAGFWSQVAAGGVSYGFLPSVAVGEGLGFAKPCMGSTIAIRRTTLAQIGGFEAFADILADDYAIGAAVRKIGQNVKVAPMILAHGCTETSLGAVWRHELRWHATVKGIDPGGYFGSILTHPLPLALLCAPVTGWGPTVAALVARMLLKLRVDHLTRHRSLSLIWQPLRDCLSFVTFVGAFFVAHVDWRGARLRMVEDGRLSSADTENSR
jgi:ceramide glucosyltransferase